MVIWRQHLPPTSIKGSTLRWEIFQWRTRGDSNKGCHLNRSGECSPYLRGSTSPHSPLCSPSRRSDALSNQQLLQTTRLCSPAHKARWHTLPWWNWMRGIVKFCSVEKKRSMGVERLVEESLIKERCKVWLPPSGETKLFIGSGTFSYLTMRERLPKHKTRMIMIAIGLCGSFKLSLYRSMLTSLETMDLMQQRRLFCSQEHTRHNFQGHLVKEQH